MSRLQLERIIADMRDRRRWLLCADVLYPDWGCLDATDDTYGIPADATLFKRRAHAAAVAVVIRQSFPIRVMEVRIDAKGKLVASSLKRRGRSSTKKRRSEASR